MILRNWINKIIGANGTSAVVVKSTNNNIGTSAFDISPTTNIYADNYEERYNRIPYTIGIGVVLGSGTTPPTVDDYKMENAITTNLNAGGVTRSFNANTSNSSITVV